MTQIVYPDDPNYEAIARAWRANKGSEVLFGNTVYEGVVDNDRIIFVPKRAADTLDSMYGTQSWPQEGREVKRFIG